MHRIYHSCGDLTSINDVKLFRLTSVGSNSASMEENGVELLNAESLVSIIVEVSSADGVDLSLSR